MLTRDDPARLNAEPAPQTQRSSSLFPFALTGGRPVETHSPTTFLERGVAVPFTTPMLTGVRARPGERCALDLIVPNPAGGRGVYILPWESIGELCRPSLHDASLTARVAALGAITPRLIREAARSVAAEGLAGRQAAAAARGAIQGDAQAVLLTNFDLLLEIVRQVERPEDQLPPADQAQPAELERRARRAVARIAPLLGQPPEALAVFLERLANAYAGIGVGRNKRDARIPRQIAKIMQMRRDIAPHIEAVADETRSAASLVVAAADLTLLCARTTLVAGQKRCNDMVALLREWIAAPEAVARELARPEWLLDGWDRIGALWDEAQGEIGMAATLLEMAALIPVIPNEAAAWMGQSFDLSELQHYTSKVSMFEDWRTGLTVHDLVARNEVLLAQMI